MAVEPRRACGYRKVGGLYLCSGQLGGPCCRLPILLDICPTCNGGVKQTRGWQWIDPRPWLDAKPKDDKCKPLCAAREPYPFERVGLLWIGEQFYPTPAAFQQEAEKMGVSRRISAVPRGFKIGETWVFFAHPKIGRRINPETGESDWIGGVFRIFKPDRIEKIVTESDYKNEAVMAKLRDAGITPVPVPDDDKDHVGSVYDKDEEDNLLTLMT
jgi:hypothetical protein